MIRTPYQNGRSHWRTYVLQRLVYADEAACEAGVIIVEIDEHGALIDWQLVGLSLTKDHRVASMVSIGLKPDVSLVRARDGAVDA